MTEADWLASDDTMVMYSKVSPALSPSTHRQRLSRRVASLFAVACIRATPRTQSQAFLQHAATIVERVADESEVWDEVDRLNVGARHRCSGHELESAPHYWALVAFRLTSNTVASCAMHVPLFLGHARAGSDGAEHLRRVYADLLREVAGNPFRGGRGKRMKKPTKRHAFPVLRDAHVTSTVLAIARQMYDSRDFSAMPILADALQGAGCDSDNVLDHCRGPGPHVRGCWVVDLVLGKE